MDKKIIAIISLLILVVILFGIFVVTSVNDFSPQQEASLEECNIIEENGLGKVGIVFFGNEEESKKYTSFFLNTYPFSEFKDKFNFYYINNYVPNCDLYKGIAILCYSKELIKKASSCPADYIIVLEKNENKIRSSSYLNVMSINTVHKESVLTHEFGHAFVNFAEEYVPGNIPRGSENCVQTCDEFKRETEGCYQGCSETNYQRSINNGVMRTLSSNSYGEHNDAIIIEKLSQIPETTIVGNAVNENLDCENQEYYLIEGNYQNSILNLINKTFEIGCVNQGGEGVFSFELKKSTGEIINENKFNPEFVFTDVQGEETLEGETYNYEGNFLIKVPVKSEAKSLTIKEEGNELISLNLNDIGARACLI